MKLNELLGAVTIQGPVTVCVYDENYENENALMGYRNLRPLFESYDLETDRHLIDDATAEMEVAFIYPLCEADCNRLMVEVEQKEG